MPRIFAYIVHKAGVADDTASELAAAAAKIGEAEPVTAVVTGYGADLDAVAEALRTTYGEVWKIGHEALAYPNAEIVRSALASVLPPGCLVLIPHAHFATDLAPGLSIKMNGAYVPDVIAIDGVEGASLKVIRQEFGGQLNTHVHCDISMGAVITIRPGAFQPRASAPAAGQVTDKSSEVRGLATGRRYLRTIAAETGDVDITKYPVLVSVGRGLQDPENVSIAQELADVLGGAVSCSRPVVDAKWMEKSRQVGSSGQTVKPKVYLACGISGSFQHLAGIKGNPFIVAINKNPHAPIFRVADVGIVADILEFLPELTNQIRER